MDGNTITPQQRERFTAAKCVSCGVPVFGMQQWYCEGCGLAQITRLHEGFGETRKKLHDEACRIFDRLQERS